MTYISPKFRKQEEEETERQRRQKEFQAMLLAGKRGGVDQAPYRQRADEIMRGGRNATDFEVKRRNAREQKALEAEAKKAEDWKWKQIKLSVGQGRGPDLTPTLPGGGGGSVNVPGATGSFAKFLAAISERESGGRYSARNPDSGAMGKYQIMPGNIRGSKSGWDWEALGRDISTSQFMASPQLQEAIARYKLQQYYNKYGPRGAAIAWYAGPGAVEYSQNALNRRQGKYSSINTYADAIVRRMGL